MVPEAPSTVYIFCTGASRGEKARDRTKWLIKCTPVLWPHGLLMELAHDEMETDDSAPIRSTVALGALEMPDWVFSALLGTPYRVFL